MKILHFVRCFTDDCGAYYYLSKLNKGLEKYGVQQYFLAYESLAYYKKSRMSENISVLSEINPEEFVQQIKPDIVHFHDNYSHYILNDRQDQAAFYDLCNDSIRIRTIHDYSQAICPNYLSENHGECKGVLSMECVRNGCIKEAVYRRYSEYISDIKDYNGITVFSDDTSMKLKELGFDSGKLFKMPPLIGKPESFCKPEENIILFAGRIVAQKGVDYLIEAAAKLRTKDWKIVIAGKGDMNYVKNLVKTAMKYRIEDRLEFAGHLSQAELRNLYMKSKIMAFPSISHETYGFSGGEAISYGIPVVAFDIDGINEWLKHGYNGFILPLMDSTSLAETIDKLLSEDELYTRIHNNCCEWSSKLCYEKQIEDMYNYYNSFLNG